MKEVFTRPSTKGANTTPAPEKEVAVESHVDFDTYGATTSGHNFPKSIDSTKGNTTYDLVDKLLAKIRTNQIKTEEEKTWEDADKESGITVNSADKKDDKENKNPNICPIVLSDFTAVSLSYPLQMIKDTIIAQSNGCISDIIYSNKNGLLGIINPAPLMVETKYHDILEQMKQDINNKISLDKLPNKIKIIQEGNDLLALNDESLAIKLNLRNVVASCIILEHMATKDIIVDNKIGLSTLIEIKDGNVNFVVSSELSGVENCTDFINLDVTKIIAINISVTEERFKALASNELKAKDQRFSRIRFVKTIDVVKTMNIPEKNLQYLIGISQNTPVNYIPLIEFTDDQFIEENNKVGNPILTHMMQHAGSRNYNINELTKCFKDVLDTGMVHLAHVGGQTCILPNLRKLGHLAIFGGKLPTNLFKASVSTNSNSLAFVFTL